MARTAALGILAALVLAWSWLRLESGALTLELLAWALVAGVVPSLLPRRRLRFAALLVVVPAILSHTLGSAWPREAWPRFQEGALLYFTESLPFDPGAHPAMHSLAVLAILGFTLAASLAIAERRPLLAAALVAGGAAWPATLVAGPGDLRRGAIILGATLAILAGLSSSVRLRQAAVASSAVVLAAVALAALPAVAKGAFVEWQSWDPTKEEEPRVSVSYVWETTYQPLEWPEEKTVVFTVEAAPVKRYWRITTLDQFNGNVWLEAPRKLHHEPVLDPLLPARAKLRENLVEAKVKIEALKDNRLLGPGVPVAFDTDGLDVLYRSGGGALAPSGIEPGTEYAAWGFVPRPSPQQLVRSRAIYSEELDRFLAIQVRHATPLPPRFGTPNREQELEALFDQHPAADVYRPLYEEARRVTAGAASPYAAAVALEAWFRDPQEFTYDQDPPSELGVPPLVDFVTRTRRGYCQHFASAMALMLRYLGVPARVAAGFTSGSYNQRQKRWRVTDHDAHTWVEVWFRGYGWLPFDPTPGRGQLDGAYSSAAANYNPAAIAAALALGGLSSSSIKQHTDRFDRGQGTLRPEIRDAPGDIAVATESGRGGLLGYLLVALAAAVAAVAVLKQGFRRARFATRDPRRLASACRRELSDFLADQGVRTPASATPAELGELVRREVGVNTTPFVTALEAARFGPPERALGAARTARRELRGIEAAFRRRLSPWERARGLVSLRSLRPA